MKTTPRAAALVAAANIKVTSPGGKWCSDCVHGQPELGTSCCLNSVYEWGFAVERETGLESAKIE